MQSSISTTTHLILAKDSIFPVSRSNSVLWMPGTLSKPSWMLPCGCIEWECLVFVDGNLTWSWLCMKAEFWWVHTKRCKRLLGFLFGLNMILVIICANLMQSTKLWLIGPSHVCYSCTWSSLLRTIVLHLGCLVDWIWSWNIKFLCSDSVLD